MCTVNRHYKGIYLRKCANYGVVACKLLYIYIYICGLVTHTGAICCGNCDCFKYLIS